MRTQLVILLMGSFCAFSIRGADIPLADLSRLEFRNAEPQATIYRSAAALKLTEKDPAVGDAFALVKDLQFHDGVIEVDLSGAPSKTADGQARGFIGIAFHIQPGGARAENIYIRPTNGRADDQLRRNHSTQYVSAPDWPWERLRKESPGVYESYVDLAAGEWTHYRIVVKGREASLFIGAAAQPCLIIHDLKLGDIGGQVALWIGPGTEGYFRNLRISSGSDYKPAYGANTAAGHYVKTPDARIYYERYGDGGRPLVLLHGGEYGYIDEFGDLIREMSKRRTVIAIATRGYGRSERGSLPLSHRQFAEDATAVINEVGATEKVDVLGFSEGAVTSYILAAEHPGLVHRLIAIGGPLGAYGGTIQSIEAAPLTPEAMQRDVPGLVAARKKIMDKPEQWEPLIRELSKMYDAPFYIKQDQVRSIQAQTLIMAGDHDYYNSADQILNIYRLLPHGQLAFIPGCGHVVLDCKPDLVIAEAESFLGQSEWRAEIGHAGL